MPTICGVCQNSESKYRCPNCDLRYCSIACYKPHKLTHEHDGTIKKSEDTPKSTTGLIDRPGTNRRVPKPTFTDFDQDPELIRLLTRFPLLKSQLQLVYGVTLEPGPDEVRSWNRQDWYGGVENRRGNTSRSNSSRGRGRGHGRDRGRGRGRGGFGGFHRPDMPYAEKPADEMQYGPWSQEKGDKEGTDIIKKMRNATDDVHADGMEEFLQLCQMRFGESASASTVPDI